MKTSLHSLCSAFLLLALSSSAKVAPPPPISLSNFHLTADLSDTTATFTLTATAHVQNRKGGSLELLSGKVALTQLTPNPKYHLRANQNRFFLDFDRSGTFPIQMKFNAAIADHDNWKTVNFHIFPTALQPITLQGLPPETQFNFIGAARPERKGTAFESFLPADGSVNLSWKQARTETEGKLFYSAEMLSQISVSPGLMRQTALLDGKVMQGELTRLTLLLLGSGEVTRVLGDQVLAWNVEPVANSTNRRLVIQFNQPQKDHFTLQLHAQTPLGTFPQAFDSIRFHPEAATRFAGYFRIINDGAVRLEVTQSTGLSQISPEQFPETDTTRAALRLTGNQRFAYRFSGADFSLRIQADQVLPEIGISQVIAYRLAENEQSIDSEIELDIREAPLRELVLLVPKGYAVARLTAPGLSDYFLREPEDQSTAELRLIYGQPVSERQVIQLRLERNKALEGPLWTLPRIDVPKAKSLRGHIGVTADTGFRLTAERTEALTEVATAFFPRKVPGIQAAFRLSEPNWLATIRYERLPQTVHADVLHLFSVGEGVAYGSSLINYVVSGAPVSAFKVELSDEYLNVEFSGKDVRNWQKVDGGYLVQLHTPISGPYTLLLTCERPFKAQGETLTFNGARPADAQSEQGHTLIISAYQFQVKPVEVSSSLLPLETAEVPPEYRLFFDAPVLAAYRYATRPFNLRLALSPLTQGESLNQVVDRASVTTRISKEGQVLTDAHYFLKSRGSPNFRLTLPPGTELWSALVNGVAVVPVLDGSANLVPLPQHADPNSVLRIDLKLASRSKNPERVTASVPQLDAPVMLGEWKIDPDTNQRLVFRKGTLVPTGGTADGSGFATLMRVFAGETASRATKALLMALVLSAAVLILWRWASQPGIERFSGRHLLGAALGVVGIIMAAMAFFNLASLFDAQTIPASRNLTFLTPVQQARTAWSIEVANAPEVFRFIDYATLGWPILVGVALWCYGWIATSSIIRRIAWMSGWIIIAWAVLRLPNGALIFLTLLVAFILLQVIIPGFLRLWRVPEQGPAPSATTGVAPAVTAWFIGSLLWLWCAGNQVQAAVTPIADQNAVASQSPPARLTVAEPAPQESIPEKVTHQLRIEGDYALGTTKIFWRAEKGRVLPVLFEPAVMTGIRFPTNSLKLVKTSSGSKTTIELLAQKSGLFEIEMHFQVRVCKKDSESGTTLPTPYGLINQLNLSLTNNDVDVFSPQAVSVERVIEDGNTMASLVLAPARDIWVGWKPRSRDVKREKPVFYAEFAQLYAPAAGIIEGAHYVSIRPSHGELSELIFIVPKGATITDVTSPNVDTPELKAVTQVPSAPVVSVWRFDPDTRKLRVSLSPAQSRPFSLLVRSQLASGTLPIEQTIGLLTVENAAGQVGLLGLATGNEVQLDSLSAQDATPINLEDFPANVAPILQSQVPGLTVRRAFRYANTQPLATLKASAVEADVRVETQDTLSLGEDRTVLAATANITITRAGIFKLSFILPTGFDIEGISGPALSHWTELKDAAGRIITLHLKGKTEGQQQFALTLTGAGLKATNDWSVPQLLIREATKQRGTLLVVPEQGLRLQPAARTGVAQLDPQKSGIHQKGVLAFRILQTPWSLALNIEQVAPWIQVTSLQHALVNDAQLKITANLQYQIENTGLKSFQVLLPTNATSVHFQGDQVADFLPTKISTNGLQVWEIKLHRRVLGNYLLQANYVIALPEKAEQAVLQGVEAAGVNLQRGFVTLQPSGRLQVSPSIVPEALQPTEWQNIPRALQQDLTTATATFAYRLFEPAFQLPLQLQRHEPAKLLQARVNNVILTSVIADDGSTLTHVRLELVPGDKRLLELSLPKGANFWFAFANDNGVSPWREKDKILLPLEQQSRTDKPTRLDVFYSSHAGSADPRSLDLALAAPKFDLPLENITWRISLGSKWEVKKWHGTLQLDKQEIMPAAAAVDWQTYLQTEAEKQRERTKEAEELLTAGNSALAQGNPQQARRAFQAAYGLSAHDAAFNEDARVQLHNIKLQQALIGMNMRQAATAGDSSALGSKFRDLRSRKELNYTQQDAKEILDRNSADDNTTFMRLAERLIQQQDAAINNSTAIRASLPEQGRVLVFKRAVLVDQWGDLNVSLKASATDSMSFTSRVGVATATLLLALPFVWLSRVRHHNGRSRP